ncbi:hypothetical protein [Pandoraea sp. NPDC087047]|uniref:hypothetical protein n=1 Tax=Pandoraea sp. NPDC087047 TaxID=3364390 RepID=UPI00380EF659
MALDFDKLPSEVAVPDTPPSRFVWTAVFVVLLLFGVAAVLVLWPTSEPTHTPWFWTCIALYPAGIAGFVVSRGFSVYEGRRLDALEWNRACRQFAQEKFAQEGVPLRILAAAIRVTEADANNHVRSIVEKTMTLNAKASGHAANTSITARWFEPVDAALAVNEVERHESIIEWIFDKLLIDMSESLNAQPADVRLSVLLDVSGYSGKADLVDIWQTRWRHHRFRSAHAQRVPTSIDLMAVDAWLDGETGASPFDQSTVLLISASLSAVLDADPPHGTAECGIGLLMTSAAFSDRHKLRPIASLHRPLRSNSKDLNHSLVYALRWGQINLDSISAVWLTGFDGQSVGPLHAAINFAGGDKRRDEPLPEIDLDRTVGHGRQTAGWLAATCASLRAAETAESHLLAQRLDDKTFVAVITTVDHEPNHTEVLA